ncbi:hypothetical protein SESBI_36381 [Sesbania bispinosa]|nr:hypothetical protein SESBI_36381 [Sesbania bispinosa]
MPAPGKSRVKKCEELKVGLIWKLRGDMETDEDLPTYNPLSDVAQRELSRLRSAQKAVHLIPLLVLLCAILLWFFSSPHK